MLSDAVTTRNNKEIKDHYVYIPGYILANKSLTIGQKLVAGLIIGLSNNEGYCWASNVYMAEALGISERAVCQSVRSLIFQGIITCYTEQKSGATRSRRIYLASAKNASDERKKCVRTSAKNASVASAKNALYNEDHIKEDNEPNKASPILDVPKPPPPPPPKALFHEYSQDRILLSEQDVQKLLLNYYHSDDVALRDDIDSADAHCQQKGTWLQGEAAIGFLRKWKKNGLEIRRGRPRPDLTKAERIKAKDDANFAEIKKQFGII